MSRDDQFAGFAHLLWQKIADRINEFDDECNRTEEVVDGCVMCNLKPERIAAIVEIIIARAAYDLVAHTVKSCVSQEQDVEARMTVEALLSNVSDLAELPEEQEND